MGSLTGSDRLLLTALPYHDENLNGLLLRLCELNGYKDVRWIKKLAGYGNRRTPQDHGALSQLSLLTGLTVSELNRYAYNSDLSFTGIKDPDTRYCYFGDTQIKRHWVEKVFAKVCPHCLLDSAYARSIWDIKFVTSCPTHGTRLIDSCPRCGKPLQWSRRSITLCHCGFDLRKARTRRAPGLELEFNTLIYQAAGCYTAKNESRYGIPVQVLARLTLSELLDFTAFVGSAFRTGTRSSLNRLGRLSPNGARELSHSAAEILQDWPRKLQKAMAKSIQQDTSGPVFRIAQVLKGPYPQLRKYSALPKFEFFRKPIADYVQQKCTGVTFKNSTILQKGKRDHARYIVGHDVKKLLRCNPQTVVRLFKDGVLEGQSVGQGRVRAYLFVRSTVEELATTLSQCLCATAASRLLGISPRSLDALERVGVIQRRDNPIRRRVQLYRMADLQSLLPSEDKLTRRARRGRKGSLVTFRGALCRTGMPIGIFVRHLQNGEIRPAGIDPKRTGLQKYQFDISDIRTLLKRRRRSE